MIGARATITKVTMTTANTDYTVSIPAGAIRFEIKERDGGSLIRLYTTSGGDYITIPYGASYAENDIKGPLTFIVQCPDAGKTLEVKYFK